MKPTRLIPVTLLTAAALMMAQEPPSADPSQPLEVPAPQAQAPLDQDPSQPVARADAYGTPQAPQSQQAPQIRNDRPPARVPRYGLPDSVTIKPGTYVTVRLEQTVSSDRNHPGDIFSATLAQPIVVDGVVLAQRGQNVIGEVAEAAKAGRVSGASRLGLQLTGLTIADGSQVNVRSQMVNRTGGTSVGNDVAAVGTTTALGAAIGASADWGRGAAIGAGAGAAAGLAGVLLTRGRPTVLYPETLLTFRIESPVTVDLTRAPQAYRFVGPNEYEAPQANVARRAPQPRYAPYPYPYYSPYGYPYGYGTTIGIGIGIHRRGHRW